MPKLNKENKIKACKEDIMEKLKERHPDIPSPKIWEIYKTCTHIMVELMIEGYVVGLLYKGKTAAVISLSNLDPRRLWNMKTKEFNMTRPSVRLHCRVLTWFITVWRGRND